MVDLHSAALASNLVTAQSNADHRNELQGLIASRIQAAPQQRISFATFMDWALYEPRLGYYAANHQKIGAGGDFVTAPHLGADFGELLAEQFLDLWISLDCPAVFQVVEMGAGQGLVAGDVLRYLGDRTTNPRYAMFWHALQYSIIEKAPAFIAEQQHRLKPFAQMPNKFTWHTWADIPEKSITGCFFSNELVDALPVHRIEIQSGQVQEIYVTVNDSLQFTEVVAAPSIPALQEYIDHLEIDLQSYPNGYRSEINLAALDWLSMVARKLSLGYLLTIDYGYTTAQYYSPQRNQGTLQCYYQQAHHTDPYWAVGHQDITAHVNFTALEQAGQRLGLTPAAYTQQGLFLMALGLGDRLTANATTDVNFMEILRRREALHGLINPLGLGGFGVLLQGTSNTPTLQQYPFQGFRQMASGC
jgi:SAM-dependent MidA family methyltransferase